MSDAELVRSYKQGNIQALPTLVKRFHLKFCRKAHWLVRDADIAKDIAQDSWQIIMMKLGDLRNPERFEAWALRIVCSRSLDHLRRQSRELKQKATYVRRHEHSTDTLPSDQTPIKLTLAKTIKTLPDAQRQVITLFYLDEYSLKEISKLLNISVGTAKSRLFYARETLKKQLKRYRDEN